MELNIWKKVKYISIIVLFKLLKDAFFVGINYRKSFHQIKFFSSDTQEYFTKHLFIHKFICYIFTFLFFLFYIICSKELHFTLNSKGYKVILKVFIFIFIWLIEETINEIYKGISDLELWMFGIIAISIWNRCLTKNRIKNHHCVSNILIIFLSFLKIVLILIDINEENNDKKSLINKDEIPLIIILGIIYIVIIIFRALVYIKLQSFMNNEGIFAEEILMIYGLLGIIIYFIIILVSTYIKCISFFNDYICSVPYSSEKDDIYKSNYKYFDNYKLYFKTFQGEINKSFSNIEILYEILVIIFGTIFYIPYKYYFIQVISILSPEHAIFSYSINKFIPKVILPFYTKIKDDSWFSENHEKNIQQKYLIGFTINTCAIIIFLIYLEIIVFSCCKLADDVSRNIDNRNEQDQIEAQILSLNDEQDDENEPL